MRLRWGRGDRPWSEEPQRVARNAASLGLRRPAGERGTPASGPKCGFAGVGKTGRGARNPSEWPEMRLRWGRGDRQGSGEPQRVARNAASLGSRRPAVERGTPASGQKCGFAGVEETGRRARNPSEWPEMRLRWGWEDRPWSEEPQRVAGNAASLGLRRPAGEQGTLASSPKCGFAGVEETGRGARNPSEWPEMRLRWGWEDRPWSEEPQRVAGNAASLGLRRPAGERGTPATVQKCDFAGEEVQEMVAFLVSLRYYGSIENIVY